MDYAAVMAGADWFSHTGPDGSSFVQRLGAAGFPFQSAVGEVLAWATEGFGPQQVAQAWLDSPPHREQILGSYTLAGIGCAFSRIDGSVELRCVMEFAA